MAGKRIGATLVLSEGNFFANLKKASSGIKDLNNNFKKSSSSMKSHNSGLASVGSSLTSLAKKAAGVVAAYASISKVTGFMKDCVSAADVQAAAEKRLETTIMNVKGATLEGVASIKKYASELQGITTVGDEVTIQGASQLATFQLQSDTIKTLLPSLQDLAVAQYGTAVSGDQMQQMANLMGKVMAGNVSSLSRYGVIMNETQKNILKTGNESQKASMLVEVLGQNFGGLAQSMANTPAGRVQQMKNAWGDMQEVIGAKLYPVITNVLTYITDKIPTIQTALEGAVNSAVPYMQSAVEGIKTALDKTGQAISWVKDNWSWLSPIIKVAIGQILAFKGAAAFLGKTKDISNILVKAKAGIGAFKAWSIVIGGFKNKYGVFKTLGKVIAMAFNANPVGLIVLAIGALITVGILVYKNWDKISAWFVNMWNKIKDGARLCWERIKGFFSAAGVWFTNLWNGIKDTAVSLWDGIKNVFSTVGEWFGGVFNSAKDAVCKAFSAVGDFVKSVWDGIVNTVKGAINLVIKGMNSMISGAVSGINLLINGINKVTGVVGISAIPNLTAPQIPLLAKGGIIRRAGNVIVGERGPEMLSLPRGAQVTPLPAGAVSGGGTYYNTFYVNVNADDRNAAEQFIKKVKEILDNM